MSIFSDKIENGMKIFMNDFLDFGSIYDQCLETLDKVLWRCERSNLVLNWEKCHLWFKKELY